MATYAFPSIIANRGEWSISFNTRAQISPLTGAVQTIDGGGERWDIGLQFDNLINPQRAELQSFLSKLDGVTHRFTVGNDAHTQRGDLTGTPVVANGILALQSSTGVGTARMLVQDGDYFLLEGAGIYPGSNVIGLIGATISITNWIRAGDYFSIAGELKMAVEDASSGSDGRVELTFYPRIRSVPWPGVAVEVTSPVGTFMLKEDKSEAENRPGGFAALRVDAVEDITA